MDTTIQRIETDIKEAMKAKHPAAVSTLRLLKSALKNRQIELMHPLGEEEALAVVKAQIKQNKDSLESFAAADRQEQVGALRSEIALLEEYLPVQLSDDALQAIVKEAVSQSGVSSKADMGRAMGAAMKAVAGRADGARVKAAVEVLLAVLVLCFVFVPEVSAKIITESGVTLASDGLLIILARIVRVLLLVFGLLCANLLLMGAFTYMCAEGIDHHRVKGLHKIATGVLGSLAILVLFSATTLVIQNAS